MRTTTVAVPAANGNGAASDYEGGAASVVVAGSSFDSGTVKLQVSYDGGTTWIDAASVNRDLIGSYTANGGETLWFGGRPKIRANLAGSSGSTAVTCVIHYGLANIRSGAPLGHGLD